MDTEGETRTPVEKTKKSQRPVRGGGGLWQNEMKEGQRRDGPERGGGAYEISKAPRATATSNTAATGI